MADKTQTPTSVGSAPTHQVASVMNNVGSSASMTSPVTPTTNVTITTTAAISHPPPAPTPHTVTHHTQSPIPQVQVIQQPLHSPAYLQQIYNPQQQLLMSAAGNITLQPTAMSPSIQVITAGKTCVPNQITSQMLAAGKQILQGQSNYIPSTTNQTLLIGQLGLLSSQPSLIPAHAKQVGDPQKVKPFLLDVFAHQKWNSAHVQESPSFRNVMGQAATLQPKSPILPHPQSGGVAVSGTAATAATATVINTPQFKQMSQATAVVSTPQLFTSQAAMIASQAQLLNPLHALGPNYQGITWATAGGIQSPALLATTQNPIFIRGQQQDMFLQSPPPAPPPAIQPTPSPQIQKPKQVKVRPASSVATQTSVSTSLVQTAHAAGLRPQVKPRTKAQTNKNAVGPIAIVPNQKADAANQTKPMGPPQQSTASQTKIQPEVKQIVQKASVETQVSASLVTKPAATNTIAKPEEEPMEVVQEPPPPVQPLPPVQEKVTEIATQVVAPTMEPVVEVPPSPAPAPPPLVPPPPAALPIEPVPPVINNAPPTLTTSVATTTTVTTCVTTTTTTVSDVSKDKQPMRAIVKPHVLTHVIEGYVIQEGSEPFPVNRSSLITEFIPPKPSQNCQNEEKEPEQKEQENGEIGEFVSGQVIQPLQESQPGPWKEGVVPPLILKCSSRKKEKSEIEMAKCEFCGKVDAKKKFKRSKRFCSTSCAKRYNVGCSRRIGLFSSSHDEQFDKQILYPEGSDISSYDCNYCPSERSEQDSHVHVPKRKMHSQSGKSKKHMKARKGWRKSPTVRTLSTDEDWPNEPSSPKEETTTDSHSGAESSLSPTTPNSQKDMEIDQPEPDPEPEPEPQPTRAKNPLRWTVQDVQEFIKALPGCADYADEFRSQEIDGQALLLLKEDHLMTAMSMKLGPALKICAKINSLKDEVSRQ